MRLSSLDKQTNLSKIQAGCFEIQQSFFFNSTKFSFFFTCIALSSFPKSLLR